MKSADSSLDGPKPGMWVLDSCHHLSRIRPTTNFGIKDFVIILCLQVALIMMISKSIPHKCPCLLSKSLLTATIPWQFAETLFSHRSLLSWSQIWWSICISWLGFTSKFNLIGRKVGVYILIFHNISTILYYFVDTIDDRWIVNI